MSSDFVEVVEMWRLCVGNNGLLSSNLSNSIWISLRITADIRTAVLKLDGAIFSNVGVIIFKEPEDITAFRLMAGV